MYIVHLTMYVHCTYSDVVTAMEFNKLTISTDFYVTCTFFLVLLLCNRRAIASHGQVYQANLSFS